MPKQSRLISSEQAARAKGQHKAPCSDCPWARSSLPGWLGGATADQWVQRAHGEDLVECHTLLGAQCAGLAIYRKNVCKSPRFPGTLVLPADTNKVFATPMEFKAHHEIFQ